MNFWIEVLAEIEFVVLVSPIAFLVYRAMKPTVRSK